MSIGKRENSNDKLNHHQPLDEEANGSEDVIRLIQAGEEPKRIFAAIVEYSNQIAHGGAALYLPTEEGSSQVNLIISEGDFEPEESLNRAPDVTTRIPIPALETHVIATSFGSVNYFTFPVLNLGTTIGSLIIRTSSSISLPDCRRLTFLAHHAGIVYERQRLTSTVQHFLDRLQVLNQLNGLIASNASVQAVVKGVARESAFRFAADVSLTLLLKEEKNAFEVLRGGGYGCSPQSIPPVIPIIAGGILAQVLQLGGHLSIQNLKAYENNGLGFLEELGISSIDAHCLEVRGEALGILIIGYKRPLTISRQELSAFQEFCQGAGVAIANSRSQERITAYTERLKDLVESRTRDLEQQTEIAEEANRAKSQFLANMSHELRTPLTAIIGYSSVMKDGIFGPLNERQVEAVLAISRSSEHLKNLIDDVLNLARVESGKELPEPKAIMVREMLHQSYKLMMQSAINKGVKLEQPKLPEDLNDLAVFADHKHLQQIIINLMSNAVKYTPRDGKVWITTEVHVDKVRISIHDTGVGIPPQKQITLFERFERGDDAYSKSQEGTGIGLNLTRHLVEVNGGRIGVDSVQGQGSTFWIMMPIADKAQAAALKEDDDSAQQKITLTGLSTLIVDDNADTCEVLKMVLRAAGADVQVVHSVRDGIQSIKENQPDIILTDLALPVESGLNLISHVRGQHNDVSHLPIIVLSACAFQSDRDAAINAGASTFIPKPFKPSEVIKTVRQLTISRALFSS